MSCSGFHKMHTPKICTYNRCMRSSDIQYRSKVSYHRLTRRISFWVSRETKQDLSPFLRVQWKYQNFAFVSIQICFVYYRTDLCARHNFSLASEMHVYHVCSIRTFCVCKPATSCGFLQSLALGSYNGTRTSLQWKVRKGKTSLQFEVKTERTSLHRHDAKGPGMVKFLQRWYLP